jgi:hypothetical protein
VRQFDELDNGEYAIVDSTEELDESTYWKVNHDKFHVVLRREEVIKTVSKRINPVGGIIIQEMLKYVEPRLRSCVTSVSAPVTIGTLATRVPSDLDLYVEGGDPHRFLNEYLEHFAMPENGFVTKTDERGGGEYQVELAALGRLLKKIVIEKTIMERHGDTACRIWKLLLAKGKLDDKMVRNREGLIWICGFLSRIDGSMNECI